MSFSSQIKDFTEGNAVKNPKRVRDGVMIKLFGAIVKDTPVDTGRLRANWQLTINKPSLVVFPHGKDEPDSPEPKLAQSRMSDTVYITNNLPYAQVIEQGGYKGLGPKTVERLSGIYSKQAPAGMFRKNLIRVEGLIAKEAQKVRLLS